MKPKATSDSLRSVNVAIARMNVEPPIKYHLGAFGIVDAFGALPEAPPVRVVHSKVPIGFIVIAMTFIIYRSRDIYVVKCE